MVVPNSSLHAEDEPAHVFLLLDVHARHRLVEQQELGLGRERAGQLHPLLQPVGQLARRGLADGLDLQEVDDPLHEGAVLELLLHGRAPVERLQQEAAPHLEQPPGHDVVEHAHALEERHVLEGARDAERGHVVGPELRPVAALEEDLALVRVVEAADHVEQGGLARAVGPDDGHDLAAADLEAHPLEGLHRPEAHADPVDLEERRGRRAGRRLHPAAPAPALEKISASLIRTAARTVPVRPSS